jgi:hypothetical protein
MLTGSTMDLTATGLERYSPRYMLPNCS